MDTKCTALHGCERLLRSYQECTKAPMRKDVRARGRNIHTGSPEQNLSAPSQNLCVLADGQHTEILHHLMLLPQLL